MTAGRPLVVPAALACLGLLGCREHRPAAPIKAVTAYSTVVLLPDDDRGTVGHAVVSNAGGTVDLRAAWSATRIVAGVAPTAAAPLADPKTRYLAEEARRTLPLAPLHFLLYFEFGSEQMTAASRAHLESILRAARNRPAPEVVVVGHTDTAGAADRNVVLARRRAVAVRDVLLRAQVDPAVVEVRSHGEAELLIDTGDDVAEARNRRVEVTVR
jgi:outer membrane protein OmpA-like peptidoglycan-associated protein